MDAFFTINGKPYQGEFTHFEDYFIPQSQLDKIYQFCKYDACDTTR